MAYTKINMNKVLAASPDINVLDLLTETVIDHSRTNGCVFEEDAARRAATIVGVPFGAKAGALPEAVRVDLAGALEALEVSCAHKGDEERDAERSDTDLRSAPCTTGS